MVDGTRLELVTSALRTVDGERANVVSRKHFTSRALWIVTTV